MKKSPIIMLFLFVFVVEMIGISYSQIYISTIEELQKIGNDPAYPLNGYYFLTNDIDASETRNWNGGKGFEPIAYNGKYGFTGVLDGKGHTIKNLYINRPEQDGIAIFNDAYDGTIKNISIVDFYISGHDYCALLVAFGENFLISNINCNGRIEGNSIGGIACKTNGCDILYCNYNGEIISTGSAGGIVGNHRGYVEYCYSTAKISGEGPVGGIVAINLGMIRNCYFNGDLLGKYEVGGIVGYLFRDIINCYVAAQISGEEWVGVLFGAIWYPPHQPPQHEITDCFFDCEVTGWPCSYPYGLTTDEMTSPTLFPPSWDFENVWWMIPGKTYPLLRPVWFVDADLKPADWMPVPKYGFPLEFDIKFGEPVKNFTFDDIDFTSSTIENLIGDLTTDGGTTWTLRITDTATTTPVFPAEIVLRLPVAAGINAANYPTTETAAIRIDFRAPVPGDLNGDGLCNAKDSDILAEWIVTPSTPWRSRLSDKMPDLNNDARIDSADLVTMLSLWSK